MLRPFLLGLLATALAVLQTAGWLALGSFFVGQAGAVSRSVPTALLVGSALTGFGYALLSAAGQLELAVALCAAASVLALGLRREWVRARLGELTSVYGRAIAGRRWLAAVALVTGLLSWLLSIPPPRDGDVMRYHLAHIRQILADGAWLPIADYCYALPFGWSFHSLPFEWLGLPQAAHLLNWILWAITIAALLELGMHCAGRWRTAAVLLTGLFVYQPFVLKMSTTAHADAYLILEVVAVMAWLLHPPQRAAEWALLGFTAWIGMQSRYQAAAVGLSVGAVLLVFWRQFDVSWRRLLPIGMGASAALLLSAPFYVMNWLAFGNPVWPLFTRLFAASPTYADLAVETSNAAFSGTLEVETVLRGLRGLLLSAETFPVPLVVAGFLLLAPWSSRWRRSRASSVMAWFLAASLGIWVLTNPTLWNRYSLPLLPPALVGGCAVLGCLRAPPAWLRRIAAAGLVAVLLGMIAICGLYSADTLRYLASGDLKRYHEYTWFFDVYDWANRATASDARFLVVVATGLSYYLDRPYRRADPCLSGVIDWQAVRTGDDLVGQLEAGGYDYFLYHDQDWSHCAAGDQMTEVVHSAREAGLLDTVETFELRLFTSRLMRKSIPATVFVLAPRGTPTSRTASPGPGR